MNSTTYSDSAAVDTPGGTQMSTYQRVVRIHRTPPSEDGTRWWAEDDFGFNGGADSLTEMKATIVDVLVEFEGLRPDEIFMTLVGDDGDPIMPIPYVPIGEHSQTWSASDDPQLVKAGNLALVG